MKKLLLNRNPFYCVWKKLDLLLFSRLKLLVVVVVDIFSSPQRRLFFKLKRHLPDKWKNGCKKYSVLKTRITSKKSLFSSSYPPNDFPEIFVR